VMDGGEQIICKKKNKIDDDGPKSKKISRN
jgi:uncharacterized protein YlaI